MDSSKITIRTGNSKSNILDKVYNKFIKNHLINTNEETKERWETYDSIISELIWLNRTDCFEEIKYRLTDGETFNDIIIDIINRDNEIKTQLWCYIAKVEEYENRDLLRRFYK